MEAGREIAKAIWFALISGAILYALHWLTSAATHGMPTRLQRAKHALMTRYVAQRLAEEDAQNEDNLPEIETEEETEMGSTEPKKARNDDIQFRDSFAALAMLIHAGKLGKTDALKIGMGLRAGESRAYKLGKSMLESALAELESPQYAPLTQEQIDTRRDLGLGKK